MQGYAVQAVAKKEYLENVRNKWIILVGALFIALVLLTSYTVALSSGAGSTGRFAPLAVTLANSVGTMTALVPILAIMLAHSTISGEQGDGSLALLFAQPVTRSDVLFGKLVGLLAVLATAVVGGIGLAGLIVGGSTGDFAIGTLAVFLLLSLVWAAAWVSFILFLSAAFSRRTPSLGWSIFSWFLFSQIVWGILTSIAVFAVLRNFVLSPGSTTLILPKWMLAFVLLNPDECYRTLLALAKAVAGTNGSLGTAILSATQLTDAPVTPVLVTLFLALWIVVPLALSARAVAKKDL
ncbi:MAG: ABC transporter permease [Thermoplasmatota archaeon]